MGKFTDQIREALLSSGTSLYVLARQIGTPTSTLSRFLSGKHGLSLEMLDRLADVLGLRIVVTVQQAPPARPGRPKKRDTADAAICHKAAIKKADRERKAQELAREAYESRGASPCGGWYVEGLDALCFYSNQPHTPFANLRKAEADAFRERLKAAGIKELACASYAPGEEGDDGRTLAILVDAREDRLSELCGWWDEIVMESVGRLLPIPRRAPRGGCFLDPRAAGAAGGGGRRARGNSARGKDETQRPGQRKDDAVPP